MGELTGRRIVVTGGNGHFARALVPALAYAGAVVVSFSHREMNVTNVNSVYRKLRKVGPFDGLVHTAAVMQLPGRCHEVDIDEQCDTIHVNLIGSLIVLWTALGLWQEHGIKASAVLMSGGGVGGPARSELAAYAASKAGVVQLVETVAAEYGPDVRVNAMAPGLMASKMATALGTDATERAVQCCLWLLGPSAGVNGRFISATRDAWPGPELPMECAHDADVYRLRRVTATATDRLRRSESAA